MDSYPISQNFCFACKSSSFFPTNTIHLSCPHCSQQFLEPKKALIPPLDNFIVPKSLIIAKSQPPTLSFDNYSLNTILHIGISNSFGVIYHFWWSYKQELQGDREIWSNVLNIPLGEDLSDLEFDIALEKSSQKQKMQNGKYDQLGNNCYSFVCRFMQDINFQKKTLWLKEDLARTLILPKISLFETYIEIYKRLFSLNEKIVRISNDEQKTSIICDMCEKTIYKGKGRHCNNCTDYDLCDDCFSKKGHHHDMYII